MSATAIPTATPPQQEREGLAVDLGFQLRALLPLLTFAVLYVVLALTVLFVPLSRSVAAERDLRLRTLLQAQVSEIHLRLWPLLAVAALFAMYLGIYRALRIVRPVYRIRQALREMAEGEYKPIRFRGGEEFRFFEDDLAQLNQKMKLLGTRNRDILVTVHSQVKKLAERLASGDVIPRADLEEVVRALLVQFDKAPELSPPARR